MDKQNILALADFLAELPQRPENKAVEPGNYFDYGTGRSPIPDKNGHQCGTAACIGGWAREALTGHVAVPGLKVKTSDIYSIFDIVGSLCEVTGLPRSVSSALCYDLANMLDKEDMSDVTNIEAAIALRTVAEKDFNHASELEDHYYHHYVAE